MDQRTREGPVLPGEPSTLCIGKWRAGDDREAEKGPWFRSGSEGVWTLFIVTGRTLQCTCLGSERDRVKGARQVWEGVLGTLPREAGTATGAWQPGERRAENSGFLREGWQGWSPCYHGHPEKPPLTLPVLTEVSLPGNTSYFHSQ